MISFTGLRPLIRTITMDGIMIVSPSGKGRPRMCGDQGAKPNIFNIGKVNFYESRREFIEDI